MKTSLKALLLTVNNFIQGILQKLEKIPDWIIVLFILFTAITAGLFKLSGTSVGIYKLIFYGAEYEDSSLIWGKPRSIRSDEWIVSTPYTIAQASNELDKINQNLGLGADMSAMNIAPSRSWGNFFVPSNFVFFLTNNVEISFAVKWCVRGALLVISAYLFLRKSLESSNFLSIAGGIFILYSPFVQWWYSTSALDSITFFFFIIYSLISLYKFKNIKEIILYSLSFTYFSLCLIFTFYLPFIVPLTIVGVFFVLGYVINSRQHLTKSRMLKILPAAILSILMVSAVFYIYYTENSQIIEIIQNTVYPGQRIIEWHQYNITELFNSFLNYNFLYDTRTVPGIWGNQSEGSNFMLFGAFLIPFIVFQCIKDFLKKKKVDFILIFMTIVYVGLISWFLIGVPDFIQDSSVLGMLSVDRALIALGITDFIVVYTFLSSESKNNTISEYSYAITSGVVLAILGLVYLKYISINYPTFVSFGKVSIAMLFLFLLSIGLLHLKKQTLFIVCSLLITLGSSFFVNPLYQGLGPILDTSFINKAREISESDDFPSKWIVYDYWYMGTNLVANGIPSLTGTYSYPQLDLWSAFDEQGESEDVYNRYAHVVFSNSADKESADFVLKSPDLFSIEVNPCNEKLRGLGVGYVAAPYVYQESCLEFIDSADYGNIQFYIYKITE